MNSIDTVTVFSTQALRFSKDDFNVDAATAAAETRSPKAMNSIGEAFVYLPANQPTNLPEWVLETPTFKFYEQHGLVMVYPKGTTEQQVGIQAAAAAALAKQNLAVKSLTEPIEKQQADSSAAKAKAQLEADSLAAIASKKPTADAGNAPAAGSVAPTKK